MRTGLGLDPKGLPTRIFLTTSDLFGIGRKKKLNAFIEAVEESVTGARRAAPPEEVVSSQKTVPPDICHECGARGGAPVAFGTILSAIVYSQWSTKEGVYCKEHATGRGVRALLTTGLAGWWSLRGSICLPPYTIMNIRSLWSHSTLSRPQVVALGICAFAPGLLILAFVIYAARWA